MLANRDIDTIRALLKTHDKEMLKQISDHVKSEEDRLFLLKLVYDRDIEVTQRLYR